MFAISHTGGGQVHFIITINRDEFGKFQLGL